MGPGTRFDFVVVGAGAAGCVIAGRIAAAGAGSVLLLEAGPDLRDETSQGLQDGWQLPKPPDWGYASEPAHGGEPKKLRRGRLVGGTSWFTRFAVRGSSADFDEWAALGNPGWAFDDVLPYFRRLETDVDFGDRPWHGNLGPIPVNRYRDLEMTEVHDAAIRGARAAGFPWVEDHNEPGAVGVGYMPMSSVVGVRVTSTAYLNGPLLAGTLELRADAPVDRVTFEGGRASGVRLVDGTIIEASTVVIAGGTYGSPQILLRSGIGPAVDLRALGIGVEVDLPGVGTNLRDHPGVEVDTGYEGRGRDAPLLHSIATFQSRSAPSSGSHDLMLCDRDRRRNVGPDGIGDPGPARWGCDPKTAPWSTRTAASTGSTTCSSPTRRSCRSHRRASATSRL